MIKEAAVLKKHNLFEDNVALPSESVSSLTDLKTPAGSNQASPARRTSALLPGAADSETASNEVFQEPGEARQPGVPSRLAQEESLSPPGGDGQVITSSMGDPVVNLVAAEDAAGAPGTHPPGLELGGTPENGEPAQKKPESISASGSVKELRDLLTVTIEVPVESAAPEVEKDAPQETLVPQEIEKEEETTPTCPEANQTAAPSQDTCEDGGVGERGAHSPAAAEAKAGGMELGGCAEAQPACRELSQGDSVPGVPEKHAEAGEPNGREPPGGPSGPGAQEGGVAMPQGDCIVSSEPSGHGESQVSVEEEAAGGEGGKALAAASTGAGEIKSARVHECQWVVENAPNADIPGPQKEDEREGPPEPPSEE